MNKLEEYKKNRTIAFTAPDHVDDLHDYSEGFISGSMQGFDAAIALDLPIKFKKWADKEAKSLNFLLLTFGHMRVSDEELYQYWIENIYKSK